jgi:RNA polymerase sigma factor (sigma-70 family)
MLGAFMDRMNEPASAVSDRPSGALAPEGFESFFRAEHTRLLRALFLVTGNRQEAEELVQDAFLAVWERWDRVRAMESPTGYLYRTAINAFRSRVRRSARMAKRLIGGGPGADEFAAADERDAVSRALAKLTPRQRSALVLTDLLDYSSEEAAEIMHVKPVTVRVLSSQGRAGLKETLEP